MTRQTATVALFSTLARFVEGLVSGFLVLRFLLKLLNASAAAPFVHWVYGITEPLISPFRGIFPAPSIETGFIIEFTTLFALVVYGFIFYLLTSVVTEISRHTSRNDQV